MATLCRLSVGYAGESRDGGRGSRRACEFGFTPRLTPARARTAVGRTFLRCLEENAVFLARDVFRRPRRSAAVAAVALFVLALPAALPASTAAAADTARGGTPDW